MLRRVGIAHLEGPEGIFILAWPWSNNPAHMTPRMARAVSEAVAGLPVVLAATTPDGLHTYGRQEHTAVVAILDLKSVPWNLIDIEFDEFDGPPHKRCIAA